MTQDTVRYSIFLTIVGLKGGSICLASNLTQSISLKNALSRTLCSPLAVQPSLSLQSFVRNCKSVK